MTKLTPKFRWIKVAVLAVAVYISLWAATFVFGSAAIERQEKRAHDESYTLNGLVPTSRIVMTSTFVPAPFIVNARWSTYSIPSNRSMPDKFLRTDESSTIWIFGWTRVFHRRNLVIS